jgi:hypothetical protein
MGKEKYDIARKLDQHVENLENFLTTGDKKQGNCESCVFVACKTNVTPYSACCDIQKGVFDLIDTFYCVDQDDDDEIITSELRAFGANPPLEGDELLKYQEKSKKDRARYNEEYPNGLFGEKGKSE